MNTNRHLLLVCSALAVSLTISACKKPQESQSATIEPAPNTLTEDEILQGWQLLFDGESLAGWSEYNGDPAEAVWRVENGAMMVLPGYQGTNHDILTDDTFENFELSLEWMVSPGANSGIFYLVKRVPEYEEAWKTAPEMQVLDDAGHSDGQIEKHRAGDLYDLISSDFKAANAVGAWNHVRIVVDHGKVEHWLNGSMVVSYELWTDEWNELVAGSKFSELEDFARGPAGNISLQEHDDRVWYRNVKIRRL